MSDKADEGEESTPPDLDLSPGRRDTVVREVRAALRAACPGAEAELRGSLAAGTADPYSDIDLLWVVPDAQFERCVAATRDVLGRVRPVAAVRVDPDHRLCDRRRLLFVHFAGLPLFWRLDLDVRARSVAHDDAYGTGTPAAPGDDWSAAASALANAVAAIKAVRRGRPETARGLLERGLARVGADAAVPAAVPPEAEGPGHWRTHVLRLTAAAAAAEPARGPDADHVAALARALLPPRLTR